MSISRRGRVTFGLQLAGTVASCEAELIDLVFVLTPFISRSLLCLLACRRLMLLVRHFDVDVQLP